MPKIWIVKIPESNTVLIKKTALKKLPNSLISRAERYISEESSLSFIMGRLLLKKALLEHKLPTSLVAQINYSENGKPNLKELHFSISHSNGYLAFISGTTSALGIDIEKKKPVDLKLFQYLFTEKEWQSIVDAENSLEHFYWFWVRKEALLKAVGCALKDLKQLEVFEQHGNYKDKGYYFESFDFDGKFNGIVAMEKKCDVKVEFVKVVDLIEE